MFECYALCHSTDIFLILLHPTNKSSKRKQKSGHSDFKTNNVVGWCTEIISWGWQRLEGGEAVERAEGSER